MATGGDIGIAGRALIESVSIETTTVNGLGDADTFNLYAGHGLGLDVFGGGPSGSDHAHLVSNDTDIEFLFGGTLTAVGGMNANLIGIETARLEAGTGNVTFRDDGIPAHYQVTPTDANTATVQVSDFFPVLDVLNTGRLSIDKAQPTGPDGGDTLTVALSPAGETVTVTDSMVQVTAGATLKTIEFTTSNINSLRVLGDTGADTFNVTPSTVLPIFIDGGDPIGGTIVGVDADNIIVTAANGNITFNPGPEVDEGSVTVSARAPVSYDHIERTNVNGDAGGSEIDFTNRGRGDSEIRVTSPDDNQTSLAVNGTATFTFTNLGDDACVAMAVGDGDDRIIFDGSAGTFDQEYQVNGGGGNNQITFESAGPFTTGTINFDGSNTGSFSINPTVNFNQVQNITWTTQVTNVVVNGSTGNETITVNDIGNGNTRIQSTNGRH